jgi:ABC-type nitrate/sulfonate/bicarbonate transport system substrate-binding protein
VFERGEDEVVMDSKAYWSQISRRRTRRQLLAGIAALGGSAALAAACGSNNAGSGSQRPAGSDQPANQPPAKLTISVGAADPGYMYPYIARAGNIFQKNNLTVDIQVIPGPQALAALVSGNIQIATAGAGETLGAAVGGAQVSIVASPSPVFAGNIYAAPNIKTPADLKGKKAAITSAGGTYDTLLRASLPKMGLQPDKDITLISTGSIDNALAALLTGAVSASPSGIGPNSIKLEQNGCHVIFDPSGVPFAAASTVMQKSWISSNRGVAQRYVDSIVEAITRMKHDKPFAIQALRDYLGSPPDDVLNVTYDYYSQDKIVPPLPYPKAEYYSIQLDQISKTNDAAKNFDLVKIVDPSFVESAATRRLNQ